VFLCQCSCVCTYVPCCYSAGSGWHLICASVGHQYCPVSRVMCSGCCVVHATHALLMTPCCSTSTHVLYSKASYRKQQHLALDSHGDNHLQYTNNLQYAPSIGIGSGQRQLIAITCIAEHASAATYTTAHALAKPQAEPCTMPSAAGKRVGRVLAGCSKPEARDKPGLP